MEAFRNVVSKRRFHAPSSSVLERDTVFSRYDIAIRVRAAGWGTWFSRKKSNFHRPNSLYFTTTPSTPLLTLPPPSTLSLHRTRLISRRSNVDDRRSGSNFKARTSHYRTFRFLDTASSAPPSAPLVNGHRSPSLEKGYIQGNFIFAIPARSDVVTRR